MGGRKKINKIGRPEILTKKKKKEIIEKFKNGQSVYALARQYAVARSVIQRLLSQATENIIYED
ncbi:hypothetical protein ACDX34_20780 [Acinetobacter bereziniae]